VVHVDDCLLFSKSDSTLDDLITSLKQEFILAVEGDVRAFLGIDIKRHPDGRLEICNIVADCSLQDSSNTHNTRSETRILQHDPLGPPREHT
jgi:hypothetical protein